MRTPNRERLRAWLLLGLMSAVFVTFLFCYLPRLNNFVMGDREFTGWAGPIAARFRTAQRPYTDFVFPIPPGSFVLLAAIQKLMGRQLVLQELALIAVLQLGMAWLAYAIAVPLTSRTNALLVAVASLVVLIQLPKEIAYDPTALACAWGSMAVGVRALLAEEGRKRRLLWAATGLLAGLTLVFKQSTATGILVGWLGALAYLAAVGRWSKARPSPGLGCDALAWLGGAVGGLLLVVIVVLATGATLPAYVRAVFVDGPALKGGVKALSLNLIGFAFVERTFPGSLVLTAIAVAIGLRVARQQRHLRLGDEPDRPDELGRATALAVGGAIVVAFGAAVVLLAAHVHSLPEKLLDVSGKHALVPSFGMAFGIAFFAGQFWPLPDAESPQPQSDRRARVRHAFNAIFLVAIACTLLHSLSFIAFDPFYNNNPIIAVAFLFVFVALGRARVRWLRAATFGFVLLGVFGIKLDRALSDNVPVGARGDWAGTWVNYRGAEVLRAARRVQELAGPRQTVLVLPEDVELAALIGRPRPPLRGAIVFVDQYPARLARQDIKTLDEHPPKVIVINPRSEHKWRRLFSTWSNHSGAARVIEHVLHHLLPARYRRVATFRNVYFWDQGLMDLYVRKDDAAEHGR
jgi:hypothetical protein